MYLIRDKLRNSHVSQSDDCLKCILLVLYKTQSPKKRSNGNGLHFGGVVAIYIVAVLNQLKQPSDDVKHCYCHCSSVSAFAVDSR